MEQPDNLSRREFTALSAAAAGALIFPSEDETTLHSQHSDVDVGEYTTDTYEFLLDYVDTEYAIPTVVHFEDESGFAVLDERELSYRVYTGETIAAYTELAPPDALALMESDTPSMLEYSPGANPFWTLGNYDIDGVFPEPSESVGHINLGEARAGVDYLQETHPNRLNVVDIGQGHGFENVYEESQDPGGVWVLELTDQTDGSFEDKEKLVFNMSVHGDERAGTEASLRFVEAVLEGERPDIASLLSEYVLIFVNPNPDGWVVKEPLYDDPVSPRDFTRTNAAFRDLNREQPVAGWISPNHLPAEPRGVAPDGTEDVPPEIEQDVPETLAVVEHLRTYENVEYLVDFHGMYGNAYSVLGLGNGGGSPAEHVDQTVLFETIGETLRESVGPVSEWESAFEAAGADTAEQYGCNPEFLCQQPESLFGYGTPADTIGYTASGSVDGWARQPESAGGLGATAIATEIVFSNSVRDGMENRFIPELTAFHVAAYQAICRATIDHALEQVEMVLDRNNRTTAYVDTESLTRRAEDLSYFATGQSADNSDDGRLRSGSAGRRVRMGGPSTDSDVSVQTERTRLAPGETTTETTRTVSDTTHTFTVNVHAGPNAVTRLRGPDGEVRQQLERHARAHRRTNGVSQYTVTDPDPGEWTLETRSPSVDAVDVRTTRLEASQDEVNPEAVLGYEQRDYEVTPLAVFESLDITEAVSLQDVRDGVLVDGQPVYDNLVISHSDGIDEAYLDALATYVERGGNLVLTDSGLELAPELDVPALDSVTDVQTDREQFSNYGSLREREQSHPLFTDTKVFETELGGGAGQLAQTEAWQHTVMGYSPAEIPTYALRGDGIEDSFEIAYGGGVDSVTLGTVPTIEDRIGVHVLGSLLPPASQENLHPFGVGDHGLTFFGYQLLCNALGYEIGASLSPMETIEYGSTVDVTFPEVDDSDEETDSGDGEGESTDEGDTEQTPDSGEQTDNESSESGDNESSESGDNESSESGDTESTDTEETESSDGDGAGFGITSGLASLGGLGYLLKRRLDEDETGGED